MSIGLWQIAVVVVLFLLLFGRGRIPQLMGDVADGIKSFRRTMSDDEKEPSALEDKGEGSAERTGTGAARAETSEAQR